MRTYQTRISIPPESEKTLSDYASLYGKVERTLFSETIDKSIKPESVKSNYQRRFGLTARQFNAICRNLKGKVASIKELRKSHIKDRADKIKRLEKTVARIEKRINNIRDARRNGHQGVTEKKCATLKFSLHQKKRRLHALTLKQQRHIEEQKSGKVRLCFGSSKLFNAQFHLSKNGYDSHKQWKSDWQVSRNNQFYVLGSKDETAGCQGCVIRENDECFSLRLRLPDSLVSDNKYIVIPIALVYGAEHIREALTNKQAISYRFLKDNKGWRVFISTEVIQKENVTSTQAGAIGVDINEHHLAVTETDRCGNPVSSLSIPLSTYGKSASQSKAIIGDAVKALMAFAEDKGKPVVVEQLDFRKKKSSLENENAKRARQLSSFAYNQVLSVIKARCVDYGIECLEVNPAYTSVIGKCKFMTRYGLSSHQAAALAVARRALKFSERPNRRDLLASFLPARNRNEHVWSFWRKVARDKAVSESLSLLSKTQSSRSLTLPIVMSLRNDMTGRACHVSQKHCSFGEVLA
jgi:IS605 OrfB family transposase|tara:strand:- start:32847 stop:34415 length:1569 start_codon:yes stop_codon:yes gene_type:complete